MAKGNNIKSAKKRVKVKDLSTAKKEITTREMKKVKGGLAVDPNNPNIVCNPTRGSQEAYIKSR